MEKKKSKSFVGGIKRKISTDFGGGPEKKELPSLVADGKKDKIET